MINKLVILKIKIDIIKSAKTVTLNFNLELRYNYSVPDGIYLLKVNNGNTRAIFGICSNLTKRIPERRHFTYFSRDSIAC